MLYGGEAVALEQQPPPTAAHAASRAQNVPLPQGSYSVEMGKLMSTSYVALQATPDNHMSLQTTAKIRRSSEMSDNFIQYLPVQSLQSSDELALLDDIDKLRLQGISHYISLPQLVVCGDQSSGKSSVLEAISGIPFPTKDNLCTRFATEVILRRASSVNVSVAIVPSQTRSESECRTLSNFRETLTDLTDFPDLVEKAKGAMGLSSGTSAFSNDVLRVEITGSDRPHLTIVDLPGLIHSENKLQTAADVKLVQDMVQSHMSNRRSIVLAIVSAKNDYANQIVLKLAKEVDKKGSRTLGIITKPDTLPVGSESETGFANLARNLDVEFRLGWHLLRNRDYETRNSTLEARDLAETQFFSQGIWRDLPRHQVGIATLRQRLSKVLLAQIRLELPGLIAEIEANLKSCRTALEKLGPSRVKPDEQRLFLLNLSQSFQSLVKAAADGTYGDIFFGDPWSSEGYSKRLRAVIQNINLEFAETMRTRGHRRQVVERTAMESLPGNQHPEIVTRASFLSHVCELLKRNRGRELPGMFNPLIVGDLFHEQSQPWEGLAHQHLLVTWEAARIFLDLTISHLTDETTSEAILREMVDPVMEEKLRQMEDKLRELLMPYQRGHPITYNHYFTETIQNIREKRMESEIANRLQRFLGLRENATLEELNIKNVKKASLVSALAMRNEADMDRYACSEALDCMNAFYKVRLFAGSCRTMA